MIVKSWKAKGREELAATAGYRTGTIGAGGKKNKMGMGTGLAAGVLGGLARVEEKLEREDSYGGGAGGGYGSH